MQLFTRAPFAFHTPIAPFASFATAIARSSTPPSPSISPVIACAEDGNARASLNSQQHSTRDHEEFISWLRKKSGAEISSSLIIGTSEYGRSLFASRDIQEGECILQIPFSAHLTPERLNPELLSLLGDDVSNEGKLALVVLIEEKLGQASEWATYISRLPKTGELHCTHFWTEEELQMLQPSYIYDESCKERSSIGQEFSTVKRVLKHFPGVIDGIEFENFLHAYAVVGSRAWGITSKWLSLIPFADFFNNSCSEALLLSDDDGAVSEVIAGRDYAAGEQVLICYGKFPNAILLLDYGFTHPYNPYDEVSIRMRVPEHDTLCGAKSELLHLHQMLCLSKSSFSKSAEMSFTIREVKTASGRGFPPQLIAFARVLTATKWQELEDMHKEAAHGDGRLARCPLKDKNKEILAHSILLKNIRTRICTYTSHIMLLDSVGDVNENSQFNHRKQLARDLLSGELRVLRSAASWLEKKCADLS